MGDAILFTDYERRRKRNKFNDMRELHFWKLSHSVRHCAIQAQSERGATVCVSSQTTKSGGFAHNDTHRSKVLL